MSGEHLLGLPLEEAVRRLGALGVEPTVTVSRALRRPEGVGALRVVRVRDGGRELVACAFVTEIAEAKEAEA